MLNNNPTPQLARRLLFIAMLPALIGCAATGLRTADNPRPAPERIKFTRASDLSEIVKQNGAQPPKTGRIIFIGVYGGDAPAWEGARYFNPKNWPAYENVRREEEFNEIALHESLMHVLAIQVARRFSNSIALMIKGDREVVLDVIRYLYAPGDKLYLAGHSQGGAIVIDVAHDLKKAAIPIQMIAHMEGFLSYTVVPSNVARAFNFYVPSGLALCPGREKLEAEAPSVTGVVNVPIPNPVGPFTGPCAEHRNVDSDPRVWKPVLEYIVESAAGNLR